MPQERLHVIGAVADAFRIFRRSDKQLRPEIPLSPEQKAQFEQECEVILKREGFGYKDFDRFVENMLLLNANYLNRALGGTCASFNDNETGFRISFFSAKGEKGKSALIIVNGESQVNGISQRSSEQLSYERPGKDIRPLFTETVNRPEDPWVYPSYFINNGKSRLVNDSTYFSRESKMFIVDNVAKEFCGKVYESYSKPRN